MLERQTRLKRNFPLMFLIQALTSVQVIGAISAVFMVYRGLTLTQIFLTSISFSLVSLLLEVPSSYLADRWGRKQVIILSCVMYLAYWICTIYAYSFPLFVIAVGLYACSNAMLSGTDEALIYDTTHELEQQDHSLKQLGKYFSAQRIFKIFVPLIAVFIAKDLSNAQFIAIMLIDVVAAIVAIGISFLLTEPIHVYSIEKIEAGIMRDALKLFHHNRMLLTIMLNKTLLFVTSFLVWRVNSEFFYTVGVPLYVIGLTNTIYQGIGFVCTWNIDKMFPHIPISTRLNFLNFCFTISLGLFFLNSLVGKSALVYLITFIICLVSEMLRWPLFSQVLNGMSRSYNRATVLSLSNMLKSFIDIPLLLLSAFLVSFSYSYLFGLAFLVAAIATIAFRLRPISSSNKSL